MSGVVLRCRSCGTTQSHPGECDACLEGEVRYFCDKHTPGLWLGEPECKECGARFGEAPAPAVPRGETRRLEFPTSRRAEPPRTGPGRPPVREAEPEDMPAPASLGDLLVRLLEDGERRYKAREVSRRGATAEGPRGAVPVIGCLVRLVLVALFLIVLALVGLFLLLGGGIPVGMVEPRGVFGA